MAKTAQGRVCVNQIESLLSIFFTPKSVIDFESAFSSDVNEYSKYFGYMLDHSIYIAPAQFEAMFVSNAHTKEDIQITCDTISAYFNLM